MSMWMPSALGELRAAALRRQSTFSEHACGHHRGVWVCLSAQMTELSGSRAIGSTVSVGNAVVGDCCIGDAARRQRELRNGGASSLALH
jgi:hypothetical protein